KSKLMMEYEKKEAYLYGNQIMLDEERRLGIEEGVKRGIEEGEKNKAISIAKSLKKSGLDAKFISENTGLSIKEIEKL
ncbi:hypothetical protein R4M05_05010, partial [Brachyspira intermedia]